MGFFSLKCLLYNLFKFALVFLIIVFIPGLPPNGTFTSLKIAPVKKMEGPLALNNKLDNAEHIFDNKLRGAECFAEWNGELYTSIHGGEVVKLSKAGHITHVVKFGQPCEGYWQESKCGRPLGLTFDSKGTLYAVDAYYGIWKVDITTGKKQLLVSPTVEIEGKRPMVMNSIALASNGDFYWTDSSTTISLEDGVYAMLVDGNGRLLHYNAAKNSSRVLLDGLWFANGVAVSPNEEFVVVCETAKGQIRRYYLKGPKAETDDIFVDGLIGLPDNLKAIEGGLLVPLVAPRDESHPVIFQSIAPHPLIRKFIARVAALIEMPFVALQKVMPHYVVERTKHWIGHFESVQGLIPKRTSILRMDWNGNIIESWHNTDGTLSGISEAHIFNNHLYLGSPYNSYIGRVPLPSNVKSLSATEKPRPPKPTTEAPTTTTAKPTTEAPKTKPPTEAPKTKPSTEAPKTKPSTEAPKTKPTTEAPKTKPTTEAPKTKPTEPMKKKESVKQEAKQEVPQQNEKPKQEKREAPKQKEIKPPKLEERREKPKEKPVKPVVEELPSDTLEPKQETLKVIKTDGPKEMPHPSNKKQPKTANAKNEL